MRSGFRHRAFSGFLAASFASLTAVAVMAATKTILVSFDLQWWPDTEGCGAAHSPLVEWRGLVAVGWGASVGLAEARYPASTSWKAGLVTVSAAVVGAVGISALLGFGLFELLRLLSPQGYDRLSRRLDTVILMGGAYFVLVALFAGLPLGLTRVARHRRGKTILPLTVWAIAGMGIPVSLVLSIGWQDYAGTLPELAVEAGLFAWGAGLGAMLADWVLNRTESRRIQSSEAASAG